MITTDAKHAIRTYLLQRNPVRALVGGRIYPGAAPQGGDFPRITIEGTGLEQMHHMTGASKSVEADYDINVYSLDDEDAHRIASAISAAMNGLRGKLDDLSISYIRLETQTDETLPPTDGGEDPVYNVEQNWKLWYSESVPSFPAQ